MVQKDKALEEKDCLIAGLTRALSELKQQLQGSQADKPLPLPAEENDPESRISQSPERSPEIKGSKDGLGAVEAAEEAEPVTQQVQQAAPDIPANTQEVEKSTPQPVTQRVKVSLLVAL